MPARVLVAPYAFKGTLSPAEAAAAIADGISTAIPGAACHLLPLADGGTGTLDALLGAHGGRAGHLAVPGATGELRLCRWGMAPSGVAFIEAAEVIPLADVPLHRRDPSTLTTRGLGAVISEALRHHPRALIIGLGDTATHDCGLGLGGALGYRFLDGAGRELPPVGASLPSLAAIDPSGAHRIDPAVAFHAFCDVLNPLTGPEGAAMRFAPQKGATGEMALLLEAGGRRFIEVVERDLGRSVGEIPGAGAGGGLGAGLAAFLGADLRGGADGVLAAVGFAGALAAADLVITGEGSLDRKTLLGKGVGRVARLAAGAGRELLVLAGRVEGDPAAWERTIGGRIVELGALDGRMSHRERLASAVVRGLRGLVG